MAELIARHVLDVNAPVRTLWSVLTENEFIQQYMFGCIAETDWKPGSSLLWKGAADGKVYVKGSIVLVDAPWRLAYTIIDPNNASILDIPENYLTVTYSLSENGPEASILEISQGDYAKVAKGQERYKDSADSGGMILQSIKKLAEDLANKTGK